MKFKFDKYTKILSVIIVILLVILYFAAFKKSKPVGDIKPQNELYDRLIKSEQEKTAIVIEMSNKILDKWRSDDSVKQTQIKSTQKRINEIPAIVRDLDHDKLIRAIEEY